MTDSKTAGSFDDFLAQIARAPDAPLQAHHLRALISPMGELRARMIGRLAGAALALGRNDEARRLVREAQALAREPETLAELRAVIPSRRTR